MSYSETEDQEVDSIIGEVAAGVTASTVGGLSKVDARAKDLAETTISMLKGQEIADKVRRAGYGATQVLAEGQAGPVHLLHVIVPRKQIGDVIRLVNEVDATAFVTVQDARQVVRGYRQVAK